MNRNAENDGAIRVLVSATSALRRVELEAVVRSSKTTTLAGSMYGLETLARHAREFRPDVLLADVGRTDSMTLSRGAALDEDGTSISTVALTNQAYLGWIVPALRNGIKSVLSRDASAEEIIVAIQAAFTGLVLLESDLVERILQSWRHTRPLAVGPAREELTAREIEVLRMLADGLANRAIAIRLGISEHTVKFHISSVLSKMGAASRTEAVTQGIRNGLIVI